MADALLTVDDVHYTYPGRAESVLRGVSLHVHAGQRIGISGSNGNGKSTLLRIVAGLLRPDSGQVCYSGKLLAEEKDFVLARREMGFLLQQAEDQLFCPSILEDVAFGPLNLGYTAEEARAKAVEALTKMGLADLAGQSGGLLSGGEQKRAAFASVIAMHPQLLFLDEPSNDLDPASRTMLLQVLAMLPISLVVISHDRNFLENCCNDLLVLEAGRLIPA